MVPSFKNKEIKKKLIVNNILANWREMKNQKKLHTIINKRTPINHSSTSSTPTNRNSTTLTYLDTTNKQKNFKTSSLTMMMIHYNYYIAIILLLFL